MKTHIGHFYWASAKANAAGATAFHLMLIDEAETMEEVATLGGATRERIVTSDAAAKEGFTIDKIGEAFTQEVADQNGALRATIVQLADEIEKQGQEIARLKSANSGDAP